MKKLTSNQIREKWLSFFERHDHLVLESAPLIPYQDESILFINAGVTPLKHYFDGTVIPNHNRLTSIQKCIRTNDIEQVGKTKRHLTFFEMMGNFSIGDYFKKEAIEMAYDLLINEFQIPLEKIYVTVYSEDEEAYDLWLKEGLPEEHIIPLSDNFWEIGVGPCGPDTEIFYDRGEKFDPDHDAFLKFKHNEEQERYLEIWNNVFSEFNSTPHLKRSEYPELPHKNIDTGAGLERWALIFEDKDTIFETDLFYPIIEKIEELTNKKYQENKYPFEVITDHIRSVVMALADGAGFSNSKRGYILRRLLRRSVRMGKKLGEEKPFLYKLAPTVVMIMKDFYSEVKRNEENIISLIKEEEETFYETLKDGEKRLQELIEKAKKENKEIKGEDLFKLYDTYGFPYELSLEYLEEENIKTDKKEYLEAMKKQQNLSKLNEKAKKSFNDQNEELLSLNLNCSFSYDDDKLSSKIILLLDSSFKEKDELKDEGYLIVSRTPFYAEMGGQVGDTGYIYNENFKAKVINTIASPQGYHLHKVEVEKGTLKKGESCFLEIDSKRRNKIRKNHSSVHLLQAALLKYLKSDIKQTGTFYNDQYFRFDFTYRGKLNDEDLIQIEHILNENLKEDKETVTEVLPLEEAKKTTAIHFFGEKYHDEVRVVTIGPSKEFCGGTHVKNIKDIKKIALLSYESKGSNVYRIIGTTDTNIKNLVSQKVKPIEDKITNLKDKLNELNLKAKKEGIILKSSLENNLSSKESYQDIVLFKEEEERLKEELISQEKYVKEKLTSSLLNKSSHYLNDLEEINGFKTLVFKLTNTMPNNLKSLIDDLLNMIKEGIVIGISENKKNTLMIIKSNTKYEANKLINDILSPFDGKGGGNSQFATGGAKKIDIDKVKITLRGLLK